MSLPSYQLPVTTVPLPRGLSLEQFIQTIFVGVSGLPGPLVVPMWQVEPPKQPDIAVNWMGLGINSATPDANAYLEAGAGERLISQRHDALEIVCAIYGPDALSTYTLIRDGFQIPTNLVALNQANLGFVEVAVARRLPELINQRWVNCVRTTVFLNREVQRVYDIPTILSVDGIIHTVTGNEDYLLQWDTQNRRE